MGRPTSIRYCRATFFTVLAAVIVVTSCSRDGETRLRANLDQWFFLGETVYFQSRARCTGAVFNVTVDEPRPALSVQPNGRDARAAFLSDEIVAIRIDGISPVALAEVLLMDGNGALGKQALAAGALSAPCFKGSVAGGMVHDALHKPGNLLAYDNGTEGLVILDRYDYRLIYIAGDVW